MRVSLQTIDTARSKSQSGLTLIEVLIALMIFAMCVGGICSVIVSAYELSDRSRSHYIAINIAKNRIERGGTLGFDQLPDFQEDEVLVDTGGNPDPDGSFRRTTVVTDVATNLRELAVTVEIRDRITLDFDGEGETVHSCHARYAEPDGG